MIQLAPVSLFHGFLTIPSKLTEIWLLVTLKRKTLHLLIFTDRPCPVPGFSLMFRAISEERGFLHLALILIMSLLKEKRKTDLSPCMNYLTIY